MQFSRHDDYFVKKILHLQNFFCPSSCTVAGFSYLCAPKPLSGSSGNVGDIAQLVEHSTENAGVVGSIPTVATKKPRF
jgi:hypothetical protein